ncbi:DUF6103 family protein [Erysipelothrix anatis]|uniref:DUF6103 family protein n=1 Tax=Erysipelothrix anatis TaxID=2683713 RepID=UPI00140E909C|nr:DUF6103 family protein [Erysipelothrix anatis]
MKKVKFTIEISDGQLSAINLYNKETDTDLKSVINDAIQRHYESIVPQEVRHFLDSKAEQERNKPEPSIHKFKGNTKQK